MMANEQRLWALLYPQGGIQHFRSDDLQLLHLSLMQSVNLRRLWFLVRLAVPFIRRTLRRQTLLITDSDSGESPESDTVPMDANTRGDSARFDEDSDGDASHLARPTPTLLEEVTSASPTPYMRSLRRNRCAVSSPSEVVPVEVKSHPRKRNQSRLDKEEFTDPDNLWVRVSATLIVAFGLAFVLFTSMTLTVAENRICQERKKVKFLAKQALIKKAKANASNVFRFKA